MVSEIVDAFTNRFNRDTLTLCLPDAFEHLKSNEKSLKFEMSVSTTIQPLKLFYVHNIVTKKVAYIFVNT